MVTSDEQFLTIKEFAGLVKVHPNTIRRAIQSGKVQAFNIGSGSKHVYRIPKSEINRIALFDLEEMINKIINQRMNDGRPSFSQTG